MNPTVAFALLAAVLVAATVSVGAQQEVVRCKTREPSEFERVGVNEQLREFTHRERRDLASQPQLEIPVAFTVIHSGNTGKLTQAACEAQVKVLNDAYAGKTHAQGVDVRIRFRFHAVKYVDNASWFGTKCYDLDTQFKTAHALDTTRYLNIFTCSGSGLLGWATLPQDYAETSKMHSIVVAWNSLPAQGLSGYDQGDTATHEVGHYLGLLHTFSAGACSEATGDGVADTPLEKSSASGCPANRDTCPSAAGLDPIWNFMDYSTDSCMNRFTLGQAERMRNMIAIHKPVLVKNSIVSGTSSSSSSSSSTAAASTASTTKTTATTIVTKTSATTTKTSATTTKTSTTSSTATTKTTTKTTTKSTTTTTTKEPVPRTALETTIMPTTGNGGYSDRSCSELGWSPVREAVCASSGVPATCFSVGSNFAAAEAICTDMGARLCSVDEIVGGLANPSKSQRCKAHFSKRFWTQTPCGDGKFLAVGQNPTASGKNQICLQESVKVMVMCCADEFQVKN